MNAQSRSASLQQFDLLPPSFRYRRRLHAVLCGWVTLICLLTTVLIGFTASTVMQKLHTNRTNRQIASTAIPLLDTRRDVFLLQADNEQRQQWYRWVQSTKPDDSTLQILAAITAASRLGERSPDRDELEAADPPITIDSVMLRLPIEFPISASEPPTWAVPFLTIVARSKSANLVQTWVDRLNSFDRITAASIAADTNGAAGQTGSANEPLKGIRLTATPLATRVQP